MASPHFSMARFKTIHFLLLCGGILFSLEPQAKAEDELRACIQQANEAQR